MYFFFQVTEFHLSFSGKPYIRTVAGKCHLAYLFNKFSMSSVSEYEAINEEISKYEDFADEPLFHSFDGFGGMSHIPYYSSLTFDNFRVSSHKLLWDGQGKYYLDDFIRFLVHDK